MTDPKVAPDISRLEWAVGALGGVVVAAMLAVLVVAAVRGGDAPPHISVHVRSVERAGETWVAQFEARNDGDITAAQVNLEATFPGSDGAPEMSEVTLDFLPAHSTRKGGFVFSEDPRGKTMRVEIRGYADP